MSELRKKRLLRDQTVKERQGESVRKEIEICGCVEVSEDTDLDGFIDEFLAWVEARGRSFGGGFREIVDGYYILPDGTRGKHVSEE